MGDLTSQSVCGTQISPQVMLASRWPMFGGANKALVGCIMRSGQSQSAVERANA
jgi:hypothetical protein